MCNTKPVCRRLFWHSIRRARSLLLLSTGKSSAANNAIIEIVTSSSIRVKPGTHLHLFDAALFIVVSDVAHWRLLP